MTYTPYIHPELIIQAMTGVVSFVNNNTSAVRPQSGGYTITLDMLNRYQMQAEQIALRYMSTLYKIPLQVRGKSKECGSRLGDMSTNTAGVLERYFLAETCKLIASYAMIGAGVQAKMIYSLYEGIANEVKDLFLHKDESKGVIIPAFEDLVWADKYMTRQENLLPISTGANTKYSPVFNQIKRIGGATPLLYASGNMSTYQAKYFKDSAERGIEPVVKYLVWDSSSESEGWNCGLWGDYVPCCDENPYKDSKGLVYNSNIPQQYFNTGLWGEGSK